MFQVGDLVELSDHPANDEEVAQLLKNFNFPVGVEEADDDLIRIRTIDGNLEGWFGYRFKLAAPTKIYEYEELI
jgi:hypothetical protein